MIDANDILNANVLIVDDQEANVLLLQRLLTEAGYTRVRSTQQPEQVAQLQRENDYDLILLDLQMPKMDGFQVMDSLRNGQATTFLPVIVLTASPNHKLRALQAGARDFISKPFDLVEVKTRIHHMLEVRLLYRQVDQHNQHLERVVHERTAELRGSQARYRSLAALATDWYWEQNQTGSFTHVSGPVTQMLGLGFSAFLGQVGSSQEMGWIEAERAVLHAQIEARQPFLDFAFCRIQRDGSKRHFRVSGEPMFDDADAYTGYRGVGVEVYPEAHSSPRSGRAHHLSGAGALPVSMGSSAA